MKYLFYSKHFLIGSGLILLILTGWWIFRTAPDGEINRIIIISMDTTRADYLSCYGYEHKTTPNIDAVAEESTLFKHAIAPIPLTLPSHSTMMTGTIPPRHGIHDNFNYSLGDSNLTLAEIFKANGYRTGGIIGSYVLEKTFGLDQGFETYNDEFDEVLTDGAAGPQRRGGEVTEHALQWLQKHRKDDFFLFLHYYDPHHEYKPPEPFASTFKDNLYAGEIAYADHCIGQVITKLKSLDLYDSTLLIITGDHGEGLGDHEEPGHGYYVYQECIRVPLIIKLPGQKKAKTIKDIVGLVDVTPTVCSLLNLGLPEPIDGKDLSPHLWGEAPESQERYIYSESLLATKYNANPLLAVTGNRYKYIQTARPELYDLVKDPGETRNLANEQPQRVRILQDTLGIILEKSLIADNTESNLELDNESLKKLESLGYVGGTLDEDFSFDQRGLDAKDTFKYHVQLMKVMDLEHTQNYDSAEQAGKELLIECPEIIELYDILAKIAIHQEDELQAIEYLQKAMAIDPEMVRIQKHLGALLLKQERWNEALKHLLKAHAIQPRSAEISYFIAKAYYKLGEREKAVKYARKSLDFEPENIEPRNSLAKTLFELGDTRSAIKEYYKVLEYDAENLKALNFLAWIQATSRDPQLRKPKEALILALLAAKVADYKNAEVMDTLAVAYASAGQFEQAIEKASEAIELAKSSGEMALAQRIAKRRRLFQNGKTYNE